MINGRGETSRYHDADAAIKAARSLVSGKEFRASRLGRNPRFKPLSSCRRTSFLRGRGFDFTIRDPLYQEFLKAWTAQEDPKWREAVELTPEQREERGKLAARIVKELRRETGAS
jgi:hypothetical protein